MYDHVVHDLRVAVYLELIIQYDTLFMANSSIFAVQPLCVYEHIGANNSLRDYQ